MLGASLTENTVASLLQSVATFLTVVSLSAAPRGADEVLEVFEPQDGVVIGRLATVEPAARRVALLPDGEEDLQDMVVAEDTALRLGERQLTLQQLVFQVGRRVTVHYRQLDGRKVLLSLTVELEH
jgi:hypothetical protein